MLFPVSAYHLTQQQVEFIVLRILYRFSCHYLLITLAIWNPRGERGCTFTIVGLWRLLSSWVCCCRADARVKAVLVEKDNVLKLIQSEILQTEIRVMYKLLYVLNNSYRGNKTFQGVKQASYCRLHRISSDENIHSLRIKHNRKKKWLAHKPTVVHVIRMFHVAFFY